VRALPALTLGLVLAVPAVAQGQPVTQAPDRVIVRYITGADAGERADARRDAEVRREAGLPTIRAELVDPEPGVSVSTAIRSLERNDDVLYAEPDAARTAFETLPNDSFFPSQWGLRNVGQIIDRRSGSPGADIGAPSAWDVTTGSADVVVAVIDTGIDLDHPDLAAGLFRNPGEVAGNGRDDDANGFVDDVTGWDFVDGDAAPDDIGGHGTHVSGTVAARGGNGAGVTGVSWRATLLPLRVLGPDGGRVSDVIRAYDYAAAAGADVVNLSLGGSASSRAERDALTAAPNVMFVAAAGNDTQDNDQVGSFPCNYDLTNVLCVAASDRADELASFSNFGVRTVDLAAPGVDIASTYLDAGYALLDGTSMATPHVAGAAALALSATPGASVAQLRQALLSSAEPRPGLTGRVATGGRLDLPGMLAALGSTIPAQPSAPAATAPEPSEPAPSSGTTNSQPSGGTAPTPAEGPAPAPSPASAPQPTVPPDASAPMLAVTGSPSRSLSALLSRGLSLRVRCSEACNLTVALKLDLATARKLGLPQTIARGTATRSSAGVATLKLRFSTRTRARLRRSRALRLTVTTAARDTMGNRRTEVLRLSLRR